MVRLNVKYTDGSDETFFIPGTTTLHSFLDHPLHKGRKAKFVELISGFTK